MKDEKCRKAPLLVFSYNRADKLRKLLTNINELDEAHETDLFIFADGPKDEMDLDAVRDNRQVAEEFKEYSNFKSLQIYESEKNCGLSVSIRNGVSKVIKQYGRVIVLEDDLLVAQDFLKYMNAALDYYEEDRKIWQISGFSLPLKELSNYDKDVYALKRNCSWGWATWADRWDTIDWSVSSYRSFSVNPFRRQAFARAGGQDLPKMLDMQMRGEINSWAIVHCYEGFRRNGLTVYPKESRVINDGMDGSGEHFNYFTEMYKTRLSDGYDAVDFCKLEVNNKIDAEFKNYYTIFIIDRLKNYRNVLLSTIRN